MSKSEEFGKAVENDKVLREKQEVKDLKDKIREEKHEKDVKEIEPVKEEVKAPVPSKLLALYKELTTAQGTRMFSEIGFNDKYWEVRARLEKLVAELRG